jgi:hypothetical protein
MQFIEIKQLRCKNSDNGIFKVLKISVMDRFDNKAWGAITIVHTVVPIMPVVPIYSLYL